MMKSLLSSLKIALLAAFAFFNSEIFLTQQAKAQATWSAIGSNIVYTNRSVGVKTSSPSKDFDVNGSFRSRSAVVDSILSVWKVMVADALSVGGNLTVGGNATINGNISAANITASGNTKTATLQVTGNSQLNDVSANNITAAGNISAANVSSGNISTLTANVSNLQLSVVNLQSVDNNEQTSISNLQTAVSGITSSQWKNDSLNSANIFYSGNVGIGTTHPSEPLEVSGRIKITGTLTDTLGQPVQPPQYKSIIIDGGIDQITATSGTLNFSSTNLVSSGNIQSSSMSTGQLTISDKFTAPSGKFDTLDVTKRFSATEQIKSDTLIAAKTASINHNLLLGRDSAGVSTQSDISSKVDVLMIQSDPTKQYNTVINEANAGMVGIGTKFPTEKLTVDGSVSVSQNVTAAGTISANTLNAQKFSSDTIFVTRILPAVGDSLIHLGDSSIVINKLSNSISAWSNVSKFVAQDIFVQDQQIPNPFPQLFSNNTLLNLHLGNVGIGTATPQAKLDVIGDVLISGSRLHVNANGKIGVGTTVLNAKFNVNSTDTRIAQFSYVDGNANPRVDIWGSQEKINLRTTSATGYTDLTLGTEIAPDALFIKGSNTSPGYPGYVGIGTTSPQAKLDVVGGSIRIDNTTGTTNAWTTTGWHAAIETPLGSVWRSTEAISGSGYPSGKYIGFGQTNAGWYWIVANGTSGANYRYPMSLALDANGKPTLTVAETSWPDFVYNENHKRPTFEEQERDFRKNKHLNGVATEKEILENGLDITGTMKGLTLNMEETKLDVIDLYKLVQQQQKEIKELKEEIKRCNKK